jgi:hypothetical protein
MVSRACLSLTATPRAAPKWWVMSTHALPKLAGCDAPTPVYLYQPSTPEFMSHQQLCLSLSTAHPHVQIAFTCKCCGARNHSRVNPHAFLNGTLVARCASCERWHKLSDHFGLFHDLSVSVHACFRVCITCIACHLA